LEIKDIKAPVYESKHFTDAFIKSLARIESIIILEIRNIAGDDEGEVARIKGAILGSWDDIDNNERDYLEFVLSLALSACQTSILLFENGELLKAFSWLTTASGYLGNAQGHDTAANKHILKKKAVQLVAESKRHAETRAIKQDALAFYKAHYAADIDKIKGQKGKAKDEAAIAITKQQPISFRTARDYIDEFHRKNTHS
jgi:hypothetical protein